VKKDFCTRCGRSLGETVDCIKCRRVRRQRSTKWLSLGVLVVVVVGAGLWRVFDIGHSTQSIKTVDQYAVAISNPVVPAQTATPIIEQPASVHQPTAQTTVEPTAIQQPAEQIAKTPMIAEIPVPATSSTPRRANAQLFAPSVDGENVIRLMQLVDPSKDAIHGTWHFQNGALIAEPDEKGRLLLELPYRPPHEYDFRIIFARINNNPGVIAQQCTFAGNPFSWCMSTKRQLGGFDLNSGLFPNNRATGPLPSPLTPGQKYISVVKVRADHADSYLNDSLVRDWQTDYSDMAPPAPKEVWALPNRGTIGLAANGGESIAFYLIQVVEIAGRGTALR
jgi:hypothetical protein